MSISRPTTRSSTRIRSSSGERRVERRAELGRLAAPGSTPWLEPAATGLTTTGWVHVYAGAVAAVSSTPGAVATPTASATSLVAHLSIAIAPAPTPEPT